MTDDIDPTPPRPEDVPDDLEGTDPDDETLPGVPTDDNLDHGLEPDPEA